MELPRRRPDDACLPDGSMQRAIGLLRRSGLGRELRVGIVYAFDFRTRMLPYWYTDKRMAPCSVRTLGDVLNAAGFSHVRIVLQQWNPRFRPSAARLAGRPLDLLLVSAMQVHAEPAYDLIRDAHRLGDARPLILAGGPKATYEPTDLLEIGPEPGVGADCAVTGEAFVLLDLLLAMVRVREGDEPVRRTFDRAARTQGLRHVPGLVYPDPRRAGGRPVAVHTGVQRLLRNLDELPMPDAGFRMLEPPHRGPGLRPRPLDPRKVASRSPMASIVSTQGCRFNCSFCGIPALNQRTWRHKSARRLADEIRHLHETFGIRVFFGTDDNFFNDRATLLSLITTLAAERTRGVPLGEAVHIYTEATQSDVYRHRDLLPLCRRAGLRGIWFGIEDITGELVNKGQDAGKTAELFALLRKLGIEPMAMLIHSDRQPLRSRGEDLSGLLNQADYLFRHGAVSYQCTYLGPAVGTRDFEPAAESGAIFRRVGGKPVPEAFYDGNHISASMHPQPWQRQLNILRAYARFYNPLNTIRAMFCFRNDAVSAKRVIFQIAGQIGLLMTLPKLVGWAWRLRRGPIEPWNGVQPARIPIIDAASGQEIQWAIRRPPSLHSVERPPAPACSDSLRHPPCDLAACSAAGTPS